MNILDKYLNFNPNIKLLENLGIELSDNVLNYSN